MRCKEEEGEGEDRSMMSNGSSRRCVVSKCVTIKRCKEEEEKEEDEDDKQIREKKSVLGRFVIVRNGILGQGQGSWVRWGGELGLGFSN